MRPSSSRDPRRAEAARGRRPRGRRSRETGRPRSRVRSRNAERRRGRACLDNDQTMLVRMVALVCPHRRPRRSRASTSRAWTHIPRTGAGHPRRQPHLERRPRRRRRVDHARPAAPDPLAGQARDVRLAGRRLGRGATAASTRSTVATRMSRPSGSRRGSSRRATSCSCSPRARAARRASSRRPRTASRCWPCAPAPRSSRSASTTPTPSGGRAQSRLPFPRRTVTRPHRRRRSASRTSSRAGTDRRTAKALATTAIMGRIAALLDPRHRGVYAAAVDAGHATPET